MPSPRKPRAAKNASRPAADATCTKSRTVSHGNVALDVWTCSTPQPGAPLDAPELAVVCTVGAGAFRLFAGQTAFADDERDEDKDRADERGWYFERVDLGKRHWFKDPIGPYPSFDAAYRDLVDAEDWRAAEPPRVVKVGRRNWWFWYVSRLDLQRGPTHGHEVGWFFKAVNPNASWMNNDPVGPYPSLDEALDDLVLGQASGS